MSEEPITFGVTDVPMPFTEICDRYLAPMLGLLGFTIKCERRDGLLTSDGYPVVDISIEKAAP